MSQALQEAEQRTRALLLEIPSVAERMKAAMGRSEEYPEFGVYSSDADKTLTRVPHESVVPEGWTKDENLGRSR